MLKKIKANFPLLNTSKRIAQIKYVKNNKSKNKTHKVIRLSYKLKFHAKRAVTVLFSILTVRFFRYKCAGNWTCQKRVKRIFPE